MFLAIKENNKKKKGKRKILQIQFHIRILLIFVFENVLIFKESNPGSIG